MGLDFFKAVLSATFWMTFFLAFLFFRKREAAGTRFLGWFMIASGIWVGGVLLGLLAKTVHLKEISLALSFAGIAFTPTLFLAFVLDYIGLKKWLKWRFFLPANIFPLTVLVLLVLPGRMNWVWSITKTGSEKFLFDYSFGLFFILFIAYGYFIIVSSVFLLLRELKVFSSFLKRHTQIFLLASFIPFCFNLLHLLKVGVFRYVDLSPVGFALGGTLIYFGIFNYRTFQIAPLAYETIMQTIREAVLVTDAKGKIVLFNSNFKECFAPQTTRLAGKNIYEIMPKLALNLPKNHKTDYSFEFSHNDNTYLLSIKFIRKTGENIVGMAFIIENSH
ncbi:MAG: PAS domain-containing protein [Prolixibacteraceae bacterium]|nr:PAS domain-containing protein [Prolixibacteraceae bacterium]